MDAFQGREKDVIIVSTVRAAGSRGIGFLADVRRMNVALTRARHGLFVVGSASALSVNPKWSELASLAKRRGGLVRVRDPTCQLLELSPVGKEGSSPSSSPTRGGATPVMLHFGSKFAAPAVGLGGTGGEAGPGQTRTVSPVPGAVAQPGGLGVAGGGVGAPGGSARGIVSVLAPSMLPLGGGAGAGGGAGGGYSRTILEGQVGGMVAAIATPSPPPLLLPPGNVGQPGAASIERVDAYSRGVSVAATPLPPSSVVGSWPATEAMLQASAAATVSSKASPPTAVAPPPRTATVSRKRAGDPRARPPSHPRPRPPPYPRGSAPPNSSTDTDQNKPKPPRPRAPPPGSSVPGEARATSPVPPPAPPTAAVLSTSAPQRTGDPRARPPSHSRVNRDGVAHNSTTGTIAKKRPKPPPPRTSPPPAVSGSSTVSSPLPGAAQTLSPVPPQKKPRPPPPRDPRRQEDVKEASGAPQVNVTGNEGMAEEGCTRPATGYGGEGRAREEEDSRPAATQLSRKRPRQEEEAGEEGEEGERELGRDGRGGSEELGRSAEVGSQLVGRGGGGKVGGPEEGAAVGGAGVAGAEFTSPSAGWTPAQEHGEEPTGGEDAFEDVDSDEEDGEVV